MARLIPNGMPYLGRVGNTLAKPTQKGYISLQEYDPSKYNPTNTEEQIKVRARFRELARIAHRCPDLVFHGLKDRASAQNMSARNLFIKLNWDNVTVTPASTAAAGQTVTNWPELLFNPYGKQPVRFNPALDFSVPLTITVNFTNDGSYIWPAVSKVMILAICPDADAAIVSDAVSPSAGTLTLPVPSNWNGLDAKVYGFCMENPEFPGQSDEAEDTNYTGILTATEWASRFARLASSNAMSLVSYINHGTIG